MSGGRGGAPYRTWNSGLSRFFQLSDLKFRLGGNISGDAVVVVTVRKALPAEFFLSDLVLKTFCFINDDMSPDILPLDGVTKKPETLACCRSHVKARNLHSRSLLLAVLSSNGAATKACLLCQEQGRKKKKCRRQITALCRSGAGLRSRVNLTGCWSTFFFFFVLHSGSVRGEQQKRHSGFKLESCHKHPLTLGDTELRSVHGLLKRKKIYVRCF